MVRFIDWQLLGDYVSSIKFAVFTKLVSFINEGLSSYRNSTFHETEIFFKSLLRSFISSNIYVFDGIILQETLEGSQWVNTGVCYRTCLESLGSKKLNLKMVSYLLMVTVDFDY
jgi:hypothetical protein